MASLGGVAELSQQISAAERRYNEQKRERDRRLKAIRANKLFHADSPERVRKWLRRRGYSGALAARAISSGTPTVEMAGAMEAGAEIGLERVIGNADFLGIAFLERGLAVSRTVARVAIGGATGRTEGYGTGALVAPRLLLTNNHVLPDERAAAGSIVEFDYFVRADGAPSSITSFATDPRRFFLTDKNLDYTLVALAPVGTNGARLEDYGWNQLIPEEGKAIAGQWVNIIQHPNGEPKQLVLRNNRIVDILQDFLHYEADTSPGSSGSPVFNDRWEIVALHHSGVPARDRRGRILNLDGRPWEPGQGEHRIKWLANEGARASRIFRHVEAQPVPGGWKSLFRETLYAPTSRLFSPPAGPVAVPGVPPRVDMAPGPGTWPWPIHVTVQVGAPAGGGLPVAAGAPLAAGVPPTLPQGEKSLLAAAREQFGGRPDVIGVRMGYRFKDGWITSERAIVIKVRRKQTLRELEAAGTTPLPASYMGCPIQVTGPSLDDMVRMARPGLLEASSSLAELRAQEITYQPRTDIPLSPVEERMTVNLHLSPDAGWSNLEAFLAGTREKLVIGMYDFGAPHIVKAILALRPKLKALQLTMQRGESLGTGTKKNDIPDAEVVEKFEDAFGRKFRFGWIKIGTKNGWVGSSYHIKVAVRDSAAFWLSSGNWQSSNQPRLPALTSGNGADYTPLKTYNREWHAIVQNRTLARVFERYLDHDYKNGSDASFDEMVAALPMLMVPGREAFQRPRKPQYQYFAPFTTTEELRVTPVLSPDNYFRTLIDLVKGAEREILIQNQTFNAPRTDQANLQELMEILVAKQRRMPVRIIFRLLMSVKARENLESLKELGFDTDNIKVQTGLHTKGVIVDGEKLLLGSHNISEMGISVNRDASLLFEDGAIAKHFRDVFEHDWKNLAQQWIGDDMEAAWPEAAEDGGVPAREGYEILTPKEYLELL